MNKYLIFIFSLMISQVVCGMHTAIFVNNKPHKADYYTKLYTALLLKNHFYSLIPQDIRFVSEGDILHEVSALKNISHNNNSNILTFMYGEKQVSCRLSYTGVCLSKKGVKAALESDAALVRCAYFQLLNR